MACRREDDLTLDALELEGMSSGHLCLNLTVSVAWEGFQAYAKLLIDALGATATKELESVEMAIWRLSLDSATVSLVFSDYPPMVSLESEDDEGDLALRAALERLMNIRDRQARS